MSDELILITREEPIAVVQLNRPQALNALNGAVMKQVTDTLDELDHDEAIRCIVITGNERAFAAGADIKDMAQASPVEMLSRNWIAYWDRIKKVSKPIIAAVSGYALGGGCELAMACDIIIASESAQLGCIARSPPQTGDALAERTKTLIDPLQHCLLSQSIELYSCNSWRRSRPCSSFRTAGGICPKASSAR